MIICDFYLAINYLTNLVSCLFFKIGVSQGIFNLINLFPYVFFFFRRSAFIIWPKVTRAFSTNAGEEVAKFVDGIVSVSPPLRRKSASPSSGFSWHAR